jgi:hypothetical protein
MISKVTEAEINLFRQSKSSAYSLLDNQKYESSAIPINPNTLNFLDKELEILFTKEQFLDKTQEAWSAEFKTVIIFYYIISTLLFVSLASFSILIYSSNSSSTSQFCSQFIILVVLLMGNFWILWMMRRKRMYLLISKGLFTAFAVLVDTFFILCDDKVLTSFLNIDYSNNSLPFTLALLTFSYLTRSVLLDDFFHYFITVIHAIILFLVSNLAFAQVGLYSKLSECCIVCIYLIYQLVEVHLNCLRSKVIFWRKYKEEQVIFSGVDLEKSHLKDFQTETEHLIHMCEKVKTDIKFAVKAIMFKDIKEKLKESLLNIQRIKRIVGHGSLESSIMLENHVKDEEDREFILQNYQEVLSTNEFSRAYTSVSVLEQSTQHVYGIEELAGVLESVGKNWSFDIWFVFETTGKSVGIIGKYLFDKYRLGSRFQVIDEVVDRYFNALEDAYRDSPYHNACHGADVTHSLMYFYINSEIYKFLNPVETMASIVAALGHDVAHPGLNARYLILTRDLLSIQYNDSSVLENMHCSLIFQIMTRPGHDLFIHLDIENWVLTRKIIIEMILSTDMAKHFEILGRFRTRSTILNDLNLDKFDDKLLIFSAALKTADIGHSAKYTDLHQKWTKLLMEEFFKQGDMEKSRGYPISMYCDRSNTNIGKSQAGFLRNICLPLFEVWTKFLNSATINRVLEELKKNIEFWENVQKSRRATQPVTSDTIKLTSL